MNDTIKLLAMEYKKARMAVDNYPDYGAYKEYVTATRYQDSFARILANAVLDAIEQEAN